MSTKTVAFLLVALTLLVIALSVGGAIYYMLFWMLMMMLLVSLETALATLWSIRVSTSAQRTRAVRGETVAIRVKIQRGTLLPVGLVEMEVSTPDDERAAGKISVMLPPRREREYRYAVVCPHRGHYQMGVTRVRVSDVFGLFTFGRKIEGGNVSVTVIPRTTPVEAIALEASDNGPQGRVRTSEDISSPSGSSLISSTL